MELISTIEIIKEKLAYCSLDFETDAGSLSPLPIESSHIELPDGSIIELDWPTKFGCGEILLKPGQGYWSDFCSLRKSEANLIDRLYGMFKMCELDMQRKLGANILVCGGAS